MVGDGDAHSAASFSAASLSGPSSLLLGNPSAAVNFTATASLPPLDLSSITQAARSENSPAAIDASPNSQGSYTSASPPEPRVAGLTSITHLLHSTPALPVESLSVHNHKHAQTVDTIQGTGDGFVKMNWRHGEGHEDAAEPSAPIDTLLQGLGREEFVELTERYFAGPARHFPVLTRADCWNATSLSPLLLYMVCGVAAMAHDVPSNILRSIKLLIAQTLKNDEMLTAPSLQTIQALLLYSYTFELEKGTTANKTWLYLGLAVKMAQDIGLHRETPSASPQEAEQRRRIWAGCIIVDRWVSAAYGLPMTIDLADCDRACPSFEEWTALPDATVCRTPAGSSTMLFARHMFALSLLLGKVFKLLYSATGVRYVTDDQLESIQEELDYWDASLPKTLRFTGANSSVDAGKILLSPVTRFEALSDAPWCRPVESLSAHRHVLASPSLLWNQLRARSLLKFCHDV